MKILIDHNLDWRLKNYLPAAYEIRTVFEMGWSDLMNGELLDVSDRFFDVLLTADVNIQHQQNLLRRTIAIVIIRARDNRLETHIPLMAQVAKVLETISSGEIVEVGEKSFDGP